jgi:hypothetical protein
MLINSGHKCGNTFKIFTNDKKYGEYYNLGISGMIRQKKFERF